MTLSYRASGLLAHLHATTQPGQPVDTGGLARPEHREGRDAIRAMLRELAAAGHVTIDRRQDARGHWSTTTTLLPQTGNTLVAPETAQPASVNPSPQVRPETEYPASANPASVNPASVETTSPQVTPKTDSPTPVNPPRAHTHAVLPTPVGSGSTSSSVVTTKTQSASRFHADAGARTRDTLANLNATAVQRPDAYTLVSSWADTLTTPILTSQRRALAKAVDQLLADGAQLPTLRDALNRWATQGHSPNYLPHAYVDAARAARAALSSQDVPGSRVQPPAKTPTRRLAKALAALHPDDPARAELLGIAPTPPPLRMIEGKSA